MHFFCVFIQDFIPIIGVDYDKCTSLHLADARANFKTAKLGNATLRFIRMKPLVDFAVEWIEKNRE